MPRRAPPKQLLGSGLIPALFDTRASDLRAEYGRTLADLLRNEGSLFRDTGFKGSIGEGGALTFDVDPTANFGSYQNLLRDAATQLMGARQAAASRGIKGGLAKSRQALIRQMIEANKSNLLTGFQNKASELWSARGHALGNLQGGLNRLEGEALDWWNQYGPDDPEPAPPAPPPAAAPPAPPPPPAWIPPGLQQAEGTEISSAAQPQPFNWQQTLQNTVGKLAKKRINQGWY